MTTWFTSDLHFWHRNIIKYCSRPWARDPAAPTKQDVEEMNHALIENWNRVVGVDDVVWNLGDLAYTCGVPQAVECLRQLNRPHNFLRGNHDGWIDGLTPALVTSGALDGLLLKDPLIDIVVDGQAIALCHYPLRSWNKCQKGSWHLHGHTHALLPPHGKSVDVGVDNVREVLGAEFIPGPCMSEATWRRHLYRPISFEEVKAYMDTRPVGPHEEFAGYVPRGTTEVAGG